MILDREDNLYCGNRHGDIMRFFGPDHTRHEIFAHVGGQPLGLAFDRTAISTSASAAWGFIRSRRTASSTSSRTRPTAHCSRWSTNSRLRLADDLDIAPDGRVFFSEATIRFEMHEWPVDALESRGNGRIICYDPKTGKSHTEVSNLIFPNGICMLPDGESFFFAETFGCRVSRYWYAGPKKGRLEIVIDNMPGYPDNINRASDGNYWLAIVGMRSPALDLALRMPGFRRRMARRIAPDAWMYPNLNTGCVIKFNEKGEVLESLWDLGGKNHPMITSIREHKGILYLGGIYNNRIGTYKIPGADPELVRARYLLGAASDRRAAAGGRQFSRARRSRGDRARHGRAVQTQPAAGSCRTRADSTRDRQSRGDAGRHASTPAANARTAFRAARSRASPPPYPPGSGRPAARWRSALTTAASRSAAARMTAAASIRLTAKSSTVRLLRCFSMPAR